MTDAVKALCERTAEITNVRHAEQVLEWDLQTYMPSGAASARARQLGTISRIAHEMFTADGTGRLIEKAEREVSSLDPDSDEARLVRNARRDYDRAVRIPGSLAAEFSRHTAEADPVWRAARQASDFAQFKPSLAKTLELVREMADRWGYEDDPYDALLDGFEPGAKTAEVAAIFDGLKPHMVELTRKIVESGVKNDPPLKGSFPKDIQHSFTLKLAEMVGYDLAHGRQDLATHPFCTSFSRDDVRITIRFEESNLDSGMYGALHETGHALYEQGLPADLEGTPLGASASMGFHESQSRMCENLVGRSRAFGRFVLPHIKRTFTDQLSGITADHFYRAVNRVEPSFIRVEADEVTYNLHILLRFDLERDMLAGAINLDDLPEAWNEKMREYLGITPPNDALGVLQDVHWAGGMFGYFPTYALGNLISAQLWTAVQRDIHDMESRIESGDFRPLLEWLREKIHRQGRRYSPAELIAKVTGEPLNPRFFVDYVNRKFGDLYSLK